MKLMIVSGTGFGLGFAPMVEFDGHAVTRCTIGSAAQELATHLPDVLIYDAVECSQQADVARNRGVKVLGASQWSNLLESNNEYKTSIIKAIGYNVYQESTTGIETEVVAWFNGNNFIAKFLAFNSSKILTGGLGVDVLSSGYVAVFGMEKAKLVETTLAPLEKFLRKAGHRGVFSVTTVTDNKGVVYVKDITANLNRPWTQALYANINKRMSSSILMNMFDENSKPIAYIDKYVAGVMVSVAPYPYQCPATPVEIRGVNPQNLKHMWQMDMTKQGDAYVSGQISGVIGFATSRGTTPEEASRRAYRVISNLSIDNVQYRTDIGRGVTEKLLNLGHLGMVPKV